MGKSITVNNIKIPDKCECIWCGGTMFRQGQFYMGAGANQFALFCDNCGAVTIHAHDFNRKINGFSIEYVYENRDEDLEE